MPGAFCWDDGGRKATRHRSCETSRKKQDRRCICRASLEARSRSRRQTTVTPQSEKVNASFRGEECSLHCSCIHCAKSFQNGPPTGRCGTFRPDVFLITRRKSRTADSSFLLSKDVPKWALRCRNTLLAGVRSVWDKFSNRKILGHLFHRESRGRLRRGTRFNAYFPPFFALFRCIPAFGTSFERRFSSTEGFSPGERYFI